MSPELPHFISPSIPAEPPVDDIDLDWLSPRQKRELDSDQVSVELAIQTPEHGLAHGATGPSLP